MIMKQLKLIAYSLERIVGKTMNHKKVMIIELESGNSYVRRVSHSKLQELIMDPSIKAVKFL